MGFNALDFGQTTPRQSCKARGKLLVRRIVEYVHWQKRFAAANRFFL